MLPPGDAGVARGLGGLLGLEPGSSLDSVAERLGDHRGYPCFRSLGSSLLTNHWVRAAPSPS